MQVDSSQRTQQSNHQQSNLTYQSELQQHPPPLQTAKHYRHKIRSTFELDE